MARITVVNAHPRYRIPGDFVRRSVRTVLRGERISEATVAVVFIDGRRSRVLNRRYLRHDYATDVISFLLEEGENLEGEIYVTVERAREQADRYGVSFRNEIARLAIHGTLHLVGYDDRKQREKRRMKRREDAYVASVVPEQRRHSGK